MKKWIVLVGLLIVNFAYGQNNVAQDAYLIFENNCLGCHGESGTFKETLFMTYDNLIEKGSVIPSDPDASELYKRLLASTDQGARMPFNQPQLPPEFIATIRQWIEMGAPDWAVTIGDRTFITQGTMMDTIKTHLDTLNAFDRSYARYFSMTHLYNAGEPLDVLADYQLALNKLVNGLSWELQIVNPQPINTEQTIYYIDLRDYRWDKSEAWAELEQEYPYHIAFNAPEQTGLQEKLTDLQTEMNCEVPALHIDWFIANASLPPLYHDILDLPETDRELETLLGVDVVDNLLNAPGHSVWRAGFSESKVSSNNRVVERHTSSYGAYWKSYDFAGSVGKQNIFVHPISFVHDGGEVVFSLPNGLQAYYLSDAKSNRLDVAPIDIVSNPAASDQRVRNGLSCIGCHTDGMKTFEDTVRQAIEQTPTPLYDKDAALRLYVEQSVMNTLVEGDAKRYKDALEKTGGTIGGIEPIHRFYEAFQKPVTTAHAAAALGLGTETFIQKIGENTDLQAIGLVPLVENGNLNRDTWTSNFSSVVFVLYPPDLPEIPIDPGIDPITPDPDDTVNIPDPNLRAVIASILVKTVTEPITVKEMATLESLVLNRKNVSDITGLEHAINMHQLRLEQNKISDLSPIANLVNLIEIKVQEDFVTDLSPIAANVNLKKISIEETPIRDFSVISQFEHLEEVNLNDIPFDVDFSFLSTHNLKEFTSWGNTILDLTVITHMTNLTVLDLCGSELTDISPLSELPNLKSLYLRTNNISDISSIAKLPNLTRLNLDQNNITDLSQLSEMTQLTWLRVTRNPINDYSPLEVLVENGTTIVPRGFVFTADSKPVKIDWTNGVEVEVLQTFDFHINALFITDLTGWQCNIKFDSEYLEAIEVIEGDFLKKDGTPTLFQEGTIDNENGIISGFNVIRLNATGISGSGKLITIKFKAKKVGGTQFNYGSCYLGSNLGVEIPSVASHGEGNELDTFRVRIVEELEPEFTGPAWDVNRDGIINILDLILVANELGNSNTAADVNGDGVVNILDLTFVASKLGEEE